MNKSEARDNFFLSVIKGIGVSIIATLVGVLIFAIVVKFAVFNASVIKAVNQFIKILSVFLGCFFAVRSSLGFFKGAFIGGLSTVFIYLIFLLIGGQISFGFSFVIDVIFTVIIGAISGTITVNVKK